ERFHSADEFIGALLPLQLKALPLPEPPKDAKDKLAEIMAEVIAERWDKALSFCPQEWVPIRDQILRRRERAELIAEAQPLLSHDGFDLRFVGIDSFESAQSAGTDTVGPGTVRIYRVSGPVGEVLDIGYFISNCGTRWVSTVDVYETQYPLKRLGQGLRLGIREHGEQLVAELAQAQINSEELWSNCYKADRDQLNSGAAVDSDALFQTHGATRFGTKEAILGDTSNRRKYLCSTFPQSAVDLPAVLYLVTRILPLARGVRHQ
ncbi:MAG: hypothetical protein ACKOA6_02115, partial [Actinomycetota bacterium]